MARKFTIFFLAMLLALSLTACGNEKGSDVSDEQNGNSFSTENENSNQAAVTAQYTVGDIVLADGSIAKAESLTALDRGDAPVAVIAGFRDDGAAFGVGVHRSDQPLPWALEDTTGYGMKFVDTVCTQNTDQSFSGDTDGSDNWSKMCAADSDGTANAENNYPVFHFVNTYADTYGLTGAYASGWYMPSIAELSSVYENRDAINASLAKIYELDHSAAMNGLTTNWYWSSSQADSEDDYAWFVHFFNGYAGECPKNFTNVHVIAIRDF